MVNPKVATGMLMAGTYFVCRLLEEGIKIGAAGWKARRSDPGSTATDVTTDKAADPVKNDK